eukprot:663365-Hanusia_phi.AAC.1
MTLKSESFGVTILIHTRIRRRRTPSAAESCQQRAAGAGGPLYRRYGHAAGRRGTRRGGPQPRSTAAVTRPAGRPAVTVLP